MAQDVDPAFSPPFRLDLGAQWQVPVPTMSLRDYFAAAALQALHGQIADIFTATLVPPEDAAPIVQRAYVAKRIESIAGTAYAVADAMLAERAKEA